MQEFSGALLVSMASFALASSISPGPVNVVALSSGARYGFHRSLAHVSGATVGFTLLLLLTGFGVSAIVVDHPAAMVATRFAGVAFLLYMAWGLATADGGIKGGMVIKAPSFIAGAALQWLNPKAWVAAIAGMGAYGLGDDGTRLWVFAGLYFVICYLSIGAWAFAGARLAGQFANPSRMRLFNRLMAAALALSAGYLALEV
jgi:threonine/homoserine/homoserine lactone efflux protein